MASITIRNLDDSLKQRLRVRAAENGHSMEEEARILLRLGMNVPSKKYRNIGVAIMEEFQALGGVDLELPPRGPGRDPPDFT
jgi:plasmid stability protein